MSQNQQPRDVDTLQWWKANKARFKALAHVAEVHRYSGHIRSIRIYNRRRACLSPDTLDALVFLNANAELL